MCQYRIYQTNADYRFLPWKEAKDRFTIDDYNKVYSGKCKTTSTKDTDLLDYLYVAFNTSRPKDYTARSLSTSDVVEIRQNDVVKYYYCDIIGWKMIWTEPIKKEK